MQKINKDVNFRKQMDQMSQHLKTYGAEYPLKNYEQ